MSPILLGHSNLKLMLLSIGLLVSMIFFGGYILGFEKSNDQWRANLVPVEIDLPNAGASALAIPHPQIPEFEEPGATIDVDSVDETENQAVVVAANNSDAYTGVVETTTVKEAVKLVIEQVSNESVEEMTVAEAVIEELTAEVSGEVNQTTAQAVESDSIAAIKETRLVLLAIVSGLDEPSPSEPEIESLAEQAGEAITIVDDASKETARYSIQVGMFSNFKNANARVEQLLKANLNAYLHNYKNKKDEARYNVRFGYFSSFKIGLKALNIYEKNFAGSGYVARIER